MPRSRISTAVRWRVWERDDFRCQHCGTRNHLTIDHIVPVSRGGSDTEANLQTLCGRCNGRKWSKVNRVPDPAHLDRVRETTDAARRAAYERNDVIRAAHAQGETIRALALAAGLSSARVHQILHGR